MHFESKRLPLTSLLLERRGFFEEDVDVFEDFARLSFDVVWGDHVAIGAEGDLAGDEQHQHQYEQLIR